MLNKILTYSTIIIMTLHTSCAQEHKHTNELVNETSPYLLQHAHNPVNWYPYGEEAFELAQKEDKLILFSIGYAACHWCHVMEHESFENEEIAQVMNDNFICVKVDKEERPDVDQIYMNAIQLLTGSGGWPLNCFALPDGRPVWGGTYFRPKDWQNIMLNLSTTYKKDKARFERSAQELTRGIAQTELISVKSEEALFSKEDTESTIDALKKRFDYQNGGFMGNPKFPMPGVYEMLLDYALQNEDLDLQNHISFTLKKWAYGGIYDQVGGGFSRYSVDSKWLVPHFEKMLYDNGQILTLYAKMYRITKEPIFKRIIEETAEWVKRDLTDDNGLFYASYDADSEGEEGLFYVWSKAEIDKLLGDDSPMFCEYYGVTENGNFEGKNILNVEAMAEPSGKILKLREKLFEHREKREKPGLDNKTLSSWNALLISGLCESYHATADKSYLDRSVKAAQAIVDQHITKGGKLLRLDKEKNPVYGFLDDYAIVIKSFLDLYTSTFEEKWLEQAQQLAQVADELFYDENSGMYFYTALNENIVLRKMEITDNVIPASNSVMANNLYQLSVLLERTDMKERAIQMAKNTIDQSKKSPSYSYNWMALMQKVNAKKQELVFVGSKANEKREEFFSDYRPFIVVAGSVKANEENPLLKNRYQKNKTLLYYCVDNACQMPNEEISELKKQLIK